MIIHDVGVLHVHIMQTGVRKAVAMAALPGFPLGYFEFIAAIAGYTVEYCYCWLVLWGTAIAG